MKSLIPSLASSVAAVCAIAALGGCAVYPDNSPAYGYGGGYYDPYGAPAYGYAEPPVQSNLFLGFGGYSGPSYPDRYWGRGYDDRGRGGYDHGDHGRGNWNGGHGRGGPDGGGGGGGGGPRGPAPQAANPPPMAVGGNSAGWHGNRPAAQPGAAQAPRGGGNRGGGQAPRGGSPWENDGGRPH